MVIVSLGLALMLAAVFLVLMMGSPPVVQPTMELTEASTSRFMELAARLGIIVMSQDAIKVFKDPQFFDERTADKLVFMNGSPIYSVYRNSYFNEKISTNQPFRPFLIQFTGTPAFTFRF